MLQELPSDEWDYGNKFLQIINTSLSVLLGERRMFLRMRVLWPQGNADRIMFIVVLLSS